jgi:ubiquinol-cytochrome c reductase iron-sulfur subunit
MSDQPAEARDVTDTPDERRSEVGVLAAFAVASITGLALLAVYALGGQTQIEGILLTLCLGGLGVGIVVWGQRLIPAPTRVEPRGRVSSDPAEIGELAQAIGEEAGFSRRRLLVGGLVGALASLGAALAIPVLSLGPNPERALRMTAWRAGARLATPDGPVDASVGGVLTVFPNGDPSDPNAATLLIHVDPALLRLGPRAAAVAPAGFVAYSKICTHAGCPVGLYRAEQHTLICPCHQSEFDVLIGAKPINGPAARPLPQLPIRQEPDGTFTALGDFPTPVGPAFWDMDS